MVVKKGKMDAKRSYVKYFAYFMMIGSTLNILACFHRICMAENGPPGKWTDWQNGPNINQRGP
jgi:hypothetical protein